MNAKLWYICLSLADEEEECVEIVRDRSFAAPDRSVIEDLDRSDQRRKRCGYRESRCSLYLAMLDGKIQRLVLVYPNFDLKRIIFIRSRSGLGTGHRTSNV